MAVRHLHALRVDGAALVMDAVTSGTVKSLVDLSVPAIA